MLLNRRKFLGLISLIPFIKLENKVFINDLFKPSQKQLDYLYGIPYHEYNATSGEWLGFDRSETSAFKLVKKQMSDAMEFYERELQDRAAAAL